METTGRNRSTIDRKRNVLNGFCEFAGDPSVSAVDRGLASTWIKAELMAQDFKVETMEWHIGALKAAWSDFILSGFAEYNPWERMNKLVQGSIKGVEQDQPRRPWTPEELNALKGVNTDDPIYVVSLIRLYSGVRVEEDFKYERKDRAPLPPCPPASVAE